MPQFFFFLTNIIAMEIFFSLFSFKALNFSLYRTTSTKLLNSYFTISTSTFMANPRTFMSTRKFFFAGHSTTWNWIFTTLSLKFWNHHKLISSTWTSFLKFRSFETCSACSFMTIFLAFVIATVKQLFTHTLASISFLCTINYIFIFSTKTWN